MGFLRRLLGGGAPGDTTGDGDGERRPAATADEIADEERARELQLLRDEQARLDELVVRQQRYAERSWVPPRQGGDRRADDAESGGEGSSGGGA